MNDIGAISLVSLVMIFLFLIWSSTSMGYNTAENPSERYSLFTASIQEGTGNGNNNNKYYDSMKNSNYFTISTENNEESSVGDLCTKLFEDCKMPATEANKTTTNKSDDENLDIFNKYLEQGPVENTENQAKPPAIEEESTKVVSKNETGKQVMSAGEFQVYESSDFGIKLLYPTGWQNKEDPQTEGVRFTSSRDDKNDTYVQTVDLFTYPSMSMNQAQDSLTSYYKQSLKNFTANGSPRTSINGNYSSVFFNYTYTDDSSRLIRAMDFIVSPQEIDKTYLFTFRDEASQFNKDLPEVHKMLTSINFLK